MSQTLRNHRLTAIRPDLQVLLLLSSRPGVELILEDGERVIDAAGGAVVTNIRRRESTDGHNTCGRSTTWFRHGQRRTGSLLLIDLLTTGFRRIWACVLRWRRTEATVLQFELSPPTSQGTSDMVIARLPSYYGATIATLGIGGHMARRSGLDPLLAEWPKVPE